MTEKIRVGFNGELRGQGSRRRGGRSGALGPLRRSSRSSERASPASTGRPRRPARRATRSTCACRECSTRGSCGAPGPPPPSGPSTCRAARGMPGVRAALPLAEPGETVRFAGQEIAALAADTPEQADDALAAIRVAYEPRPFVVGTRGGPKAGCASRLRGQGRDEDLAPVKGRRRASRARAARATCRAPARAREGQTSRQGFRKADAVVEATYVTQVQTPHRPSRPTASWRAGTAGRADGLGLDAGHLLRPRRARRGPGPASEVHVITEYMGGGFGAKFGARTEGVTAAKLAKEAGAPVKLFLDRKEEQLATGNRPSAVQTIKARRRRTESSPPCTCSCTATAAPTAAPAPPGP